MASHWNVILEPRAEKELESLQRLSREAWEDAIAVLHELYYEWPDVAGCIPLRDYPGFWRCRIADNYRIVMRVSEKQRMIVVARIRTNVIGAGRSSIATQIEIKGEQLTWNGDRFNLECRA